MRIQVVLTLPRDAASVPLARHTVTAALQRAGVTGECVAEVEVILSEACTNAYRHAHEGGDSFEVRIEIVDDSMVVDVLDTGIGFASDASSIAMPVPSADGGRGIALMAALTEKAVFDSATRDGGSVHLLKRLHWAENAPFRSDASRGGGDDAEHRPNGRTDGPDRRRTEFPGRERPGR